MGDTIIITSLVTDFESQLTLPTAEILSGKNVRAFLVCESLMKSFKKYPENMKKKSWEPFGSYLLNSTANPAQSSIESFEIFEREACRCDK